MRTLNIQPGTRVACDGQLYTIHHIADLKTVVARCEATGIPTVLKIADLKPTDEPAEPAQTELALVTDKRWREAQRRMDVIGPLVEAGQFTRQAIAQRAKETGAGRSTIWRWIEKYKNSGGFMGLVDPEARTTRGRSLLKPEVEAIIRECIETCYLSPKQWTAMDTFHEIKHKCRNAKLPAPSYGAVNQRINAIPELVQKNRRAHKKKARDKFEPRPGHYTEAEHPLDVIQIDHTELDVIVVDEVERLPIGRPWLSLGIDVCSRCVWGLQLSLEHPNARITGLCVSNGILPKENYLKTLGLDGEWPIWGIPRVIHVDNGRDFRGEMLVRACEKHGIRLQFRPAYRPNYGAYIERYFGTLANELHKLPGATFSDPDRRGEYDSDAKACLTLRELEIYVVRWITQVYHNRPHSGLEQETPMHAYERLLLNGAS